MFKSSVPLTGRISSSLNEPAWSLQPPSSPPTIPASLRWPKKGKLRILSLIAALDCGLLTRWGRLRRVRGQAHYPLSSCVVEPPAAGRGMIVPTTQHRTVSGGVVSLPLVFIPVPRSKHTTRKHIDMSAVDPAQCLCLCRTPILRCADQRDVAMGQSVWCNRQTGRLQRTVERATLESSQGRFVIAARRPRKFESSQLVPRGSAASPWLAVRMRHIRRMACGPAQYCRAS